MKTEITLNLNIKEFGLLRNFIETSIPLYKEFCKKELLKIESENLDSDNLRYVERRNQEAIDSQISILNGILNSMKEN